MGAGGVQGGDGGPGYREEAGGVEEDGCGGGWDAGDGAEGGDVPEVCVVGVWAGESGEYR